MTFRGMRVAATFGTLCVGALVLAACTGKVLSLGTNTTGAQEVAPSEVGGSVPPCSGGSAHPNVCCTAGPNQAGTCVVYPGAPFTQCDNGTTTYPDPRSCCPLDGSGNCSSPPSSSGGGGSSGSSGGSTGSGSGGSCAYACPPGSYSMSNSFGTECCQTDSNGGTSCSGGGSAGSSSSGGTPGQGGSSCGGVCACPACPDDGGACPPCSCPPPPSGGCPPPTCGACPPGWQAPQGAPDLCCLTDSSGNIECFSQAVPPGQISGGSDGGPAQTGATCSGTASTDGAIGPCGCQEQVGGHTYSVSCDPAVCTCTMDNGGPSTSFTVINNTCGDPNGLFTSCGYPL
jgi:hypothetical protein